MTLFDFLNAHPDVIHEFLGVACVVFWRWLTYLVLK
jgi:hypothetical protein